MVGIKTEDRIEAAAHTLADARSSGRIGGLAGGEMPRTEDEAYAIQTRTLALLGEGVAGWKVGPMPAQGAPRCAPIPASGLFVSGACLPDSYAAPEVEAELALTLGEDLPGSPATVDEALSAIAGARLAIEVLAARFLDRPAAPPLATLADMQCTGGIALGALHEDWRLLEFADLRPRAVFSDGRGLDAEGPQPGTAQILASLIWLAGHAAARGLPLRKGQTIITGARVGPVPLAATTGVEVSLAGFGPVSLHRA